MKEFLESPHNEIPIAMKKMEQRMKDKISTDQIVSYSEWSTINNSNTVCFLSGKPISKSFIVKDL